MLRHNDPLLRDIVVERFTVSVANPNVGNPQGSQVIRIPHPTFDNHNGGTVAFGPDGMLFISTGDGGGGGDPQQNAQDTRRLLGKMLRLDVSVLPYRIPPTNPFAGLGLGEEIWARGLRNPWRWSFDQTARRIYVADVGQGRFEEVDVVASDAPNLNYGWPITEGNACYPSGDACNKSGQTLPALEFDHLTGACAVTGGYVYRGGAIPRARRALLLLRLLRRLHPQLSLCEQPGGRAGRLERAQRRSGAVVRRGRGARALCHHGQRKDLPRREDVAARIPVVSLA